MHEIKKKFILSIFPLFFSAALTLPYEFIKGATPYRITVKASFEDFENAAKDILKNFGYSVEQPYQPCLIGKSSIIDSNVYIEWDTDNNHMTHASLWRIRYKKNPVSFDAKMGHEYEKLAPNKEIIKIGKELKERFRQ